MKPVVTRLYAVLVALALVALIAWSGADWLQRQEAARAQGQTVLREAAGKISELSIRGIPLDAATLGKVFAPLSGAGGRWKTILLASSAEGTRYYRGPRPPVAPDLAIPRWEAKSGSEVKLSLPVFQAQGSPLVLEGIYEFYGRAEVFSLLKAAGITLVGLVVLTSLMVYLSSRRSENDESVAGPAASQDDGAPSSPEPESAFSFDDEVDVPPLEDSLETVGTLPVETADEYWFDESLTLDDLPPLDDVPPPSELATDDALTFEDASDAPGPSLFSPATGMGWQSFLLTRLDHELQRSAEQNQDLALVLLAVKDGELNAELWGQSVREAFPSVDLDFEYEGGAAVVLPGRSLEQALKAARGFVESSDRYLGGVVIHAGVAARSGRLLSAQTLLTEADSAKRRSLSGTVRVLGLKTDPDRYREHLASGPAAT